MDDTKKPWQSTAMWGGLLAMISLVLKQVGIIDITAEDQTTIVNIIVDNIEYGFILFAMWGRWIAKKAISF